MRAGHLEERSQRPGVFRGGVYGTAPVSGKVIQEKVEGNARTSGTGYWAEGRSIQGDGKVIKRKWHPRCQAKDQGSNNLVYIPLMR